jgi:hypothetical protein
MNNLLVRHVLEQFNGRIITTKQAMQELNIGRSTLFDMREKWLKASRAGKDWKPGVSGGNHRDPWPEEATVFLAKNLAPPTPYSYAFAASEMERTLGFHADRAQVRLWAMRNALAHPTPKKHESPHTRRFQRTHIGELWQLDATPFPWFGPGKPQLPMLNMLDDCSRLQVGGTLYEHENLAAYIHFLKMAFEAHGLPLLIYVDQAAFFMPQKEGNPTRLGNRLRFYDISFVYAKSPQAKGKIERVHFVWQERLPPYFMKNGVPATLEEANAIIATLIAWRNAHDIHREIGMTAADAWAQALDQGRTRMRPRPQCPWWEYVWSEMESVTVLPRGRLRIGMDEVAVGAKTGDRVVLCNHTDGSYSVLLKPPKRGEFPVVLYTSRNRANEPLIPPTVRF